MVSMRETAGRKKGIEAIRQMAKAMGLVSTVRFQQARETARSAEASFVLLQRTMARLAAGAEETHPYVSGNGALIRGGILITADRGLAGGYTAAMIRFLLERDWKPEESRIWVAGKKGVGLLSRRNFAISEISLEGRTSWQTAEHLSARVLEAYEEGEIGEIHLLFARPGRGMGLEPKSVRLLPPEKPAGVPAQEAPMNFEPSFEEVLESIVPEYLGQMIYGGLLMGQAAENRARMEAMDAAERNAKEMIDDLTLQLNRSRQGAITREIAEMISGDL